ncbi:DNA cytosine methyltransferase [Lederbergia panacisoli]|uniref:DNA cytosine methyltransferase n=1 Tax=Lederbergia panacisoli TaxID=1255251 RepID=UPI00214AEBC1|nr:DNA cytosine methyltransferase [Lederbergia panacisoli]MCR2823317.1 DNA cytosine methyltransferase [Lederbergia panacisoli]
MLDLFSGAGGMSLGFLQTGKYKIPVAVEKDLHARATYREFHKNTILLEDILDINDYEEFQRTYGDFDIVVGGPPCQGFSNANRQKNHIISHNNSLIKKYVEVIENLKPLAFVMENVRMLKSETHRFYLSQNDNFNNLEVSLKVEKICLYDGLFPVKDSIKDLFIPERIEELLLPEKSLIVLRTILKKSLNQKTRGTVLKKSGKKAYNIINSIPDRSSNVPPAYMDLEKELLSYFSGYVDGSLTFSEAEPYMDTFINIQMFLSNVKELIDNEIIIKDLDISDQGIFIEVQSITVIEYITKKLEKIYLIDDGILNAAWYGAPQLRERYIALGIRKDFAVEKNIKPLLPEVAFTLENYRTVWDAIGDLEEVEPGYTIDEQPVQLSDTLVQTALKEELRNTNLLYNHITTKTRETALKRFAALKPGENFHDLEKSLINNTYTKPERTQNSIYLRLRYNKPSGTVTNVRKSMWIHPVIDRAISIREAARLQTFPDNIRFLGTKDSQYQQIGNAVPPTMARAIAQKLAELLGETPVNKVELDTKA